MKRIFIVLTILAAFPACICHQAAKSADPDQEARAVYLSGQGEEMTAIFKRTARSVEVRLPDGRRVKLPLSVSGSGARYSDGKKTFWEHQGEASYCDGETLIFRGRIKE